MKQTKRFYEAPAMQVVELRHHQVLLAGSGERTSKSLEEDIIIDE